MKLINLTTRVITIVDEEGDPRFTVQPSGMVASADINSRVTERIKHNDDHDVDIVEYEYSDVRGMPEPKPGVIYVVSYAVLQGLGGSRPDAVSPDTSPNSVVRAGAHEKVLGVKQLRRL